MRDDRRAPRLRKQKSDTGLKISRAATRGGCSFSGIISAKGARARAHLTARRAKSGSAVPVTVRFCADDATVYTNALRTTRRRRRIRYGNRV